MDLELELRYLNDEDLEQVLIHLRELPRYQVQQFIAHADQEIGWVAEERHVLDDESRPSEVKREFQSFVTTFKRLRKHWKDLGPGGRRTVGLALSNEAGTAWERCNRVLHYSPDANQKLVDEIQLFFHTSDERASDIVSTLFDTMLTIISKPNVAEDIASLPRAATRFAETKIRFLDNLMWHWEWAFGQKPSSYENSPFGETARLVLGALQRHLGLEDQPRNFKDDLFAAFQDHP